MGNTQTFPGKKRKTSSITCKMSGVSCGKKSNGIQPPNIAVAALTIPLILDRDTNSDIGESSNGGGSARNKTKKQRKDRR